MIGYEDFSSCLEATACVAVVKIPADACGRTFVTPAPGVRLHHAPDRGALKWLCLAQCCLFVLIAPSEPLDEGDVDGVVNTLIRVRRDLLDHTPEAAGQLLVVPRVCHVEATKVS